MKQDEGQGLVFFIMRPRNPKLGRVGRALAAIWVSTCLLLGPSIMRHAYAAEYKLSEVEIEGLIELLDKTSFDAAGSLMGFGRLLLWEQLEPVRYWVTMEEDDEETLEWNKRVLRKIHRMIGRSATIRILRTPVLSDADIVIFSMEKEALFSYEPFFRYLRKIGMSENEFFGLRDTIDKAVYQGQRSAWSYLVLDDSSSGDKIYKKYVAVLNPDKERFMELFPLAFSIALGYGNTRGQKLPWYSIHMTLGDFQTADHILLHFLYNSKAKSGMPRSIALNVLRNWLSSEYFSANVRLVEK